MAPRVQLDADRRRKIALELAAGRSIAEAAKAAKVAKRTLERWIARGRAVRDSGDVIADADRVYVELVDAVERAQAMLTDTIRAQIARMLASGVDEQTAAVAAGVTVERLQQWLARGIELDAQLAAGDDIDDLDRPYVDLVRDVAEAEARAEVQALAVVTKAGLDGEWRAATWFLDRKHPDKYRLDGRSGRDAGDEAVSTVRGAVEERLRVYEARLPGVRERPMAALSLSLASMVDDINAAVSARAAASRELRATLFDLEQDLPVDAGGDGIDDLADRSRGKLRLAS